MTADLRRLHITVSRRFLKKLAAAKDALSRSHPGGRAEDVLEAALDLLLERSARRKGVVKKPRADSATAQPSRPLPPARRSDGTGSTAQHRNAIPAAVKRAVWARDDGRCQWQLDGGGICGATRRLEIDHVHPHALGGPATVENTRVLCLHNQLAARRAFGGEWMDRFVSRAVQAPLP